MVDGILPENPYGQWSVSLLMQHEDLQQEVMIYLQSCGKNVRAQDLVEHFNQPEVKTRWKVEKSISLATAQRWMKELSYRWERHNTGMYVDGHEQKDVVDDRQNIFIPAMDRLGPYCRRYESYDNDGDEVLPDSTTLQWPCDEDEGVRPLSARTCIWNHDESPFSMNDRRKVFWKGPQDKNIPRPKGEGVTIMATDLVSADHGWLRSPDGMVRARRLFKVGKNHQGYFTNDDILEQAHAAIDILETYYSNDRHVLIYDNATTHRK